MKPRSVVLFDLSEMWTGEDSYVFIQRGDGRFENLVQVVIHGWESALGGAA